MKKSYLKYAIAAFAPLLFAQCQDMGLNQPENDAKTVDLILSLSDEGTKTMLQNNSTVLWTEGDEVIINDTRYRVEIDADDPSYAIVKGVEKRDKYYAVYPEGYANEYYSGIGFAVPAVQEYLNGGFAPMVSPMAAVGNSVNLNFHNLGSIVRLGLTGSGEKVAELIMQSNNEGEYLSGEGFYADVDEVESGNISGISPEWGNQYVKLVFPEPLVLSSEVQYVYVVVPPVTLANGFYVFIADVNSALMEVSTAKTITFERSRIKQMEDVHCTFSNAISFSTDETDYKEVNLSVNKKDAVEIAYAVFDKESYDNYCKSYEDVSACRRSLLERYGRYSSDNELNIRDAYYLSSSDADMVELSSGKEYVVLAAYLYAGELFGGAVSYTFSTKTPVGEAPVLIISHFYPTNHYEWYAAGFEIQSDASTIYLASLNMSEYEELVRSGMDDDDIARNSGYTISPNRYSWSSLFADTEYILVGLAISDGGMETVAKCSFKTASYIETMAGSDPVWTRISDKGCFRLGFLMDESTYEPVELRGLPIEINQHGNILRIKDLMSVSRNPVLADFGFMDKGESHYTYIEIGTACMQILANKTGITHSDYQTIYIGNYSSIQDPYSGTSSQYDSARSIFTFNDLTIIDENFNRWYMDYGNPSTLYLYGIDDSNLSNEDFGSSGDPMEW